MKILKLLAVWLALLAGLSHPAAGATNGVVLGQNFQSVIDASAPGDTLIVQPGTYPDANLVFNKPLTVLPSGTNGSPIQFVGVVQVTGAGASSFQQAYFATNVQTTGSSVSFFDSIFNATVTVSGGKATMKRSLLNYPLILTNNAAFEGLRMTNTYIVTGTAMVGANTPFLAVQCVFTNLLLSGYKTWLGYNTFWYNQGNPSCVRETNCDSVLIGNKFIANVTNTTVLITNYTYLYSEGGTLKAYNNLISSTFNEPGATVNGIWLASTAAEIINNTFTLSNQGNNNQYAVDLRGIYATGAGGPINVRGNIINTVVSGFVAAAPIAIEATGPAGQTLFLSYCDFWYAGTFSTNLLGIVPPPVNCLTQINPNLAVDGTPNPGSPCLNAGPPDAIYNNRDGTRNTMGYTGGPYWNPANYTNNNPMVFLLTGQQVILNGVQTNISVNVGASAGH